MISVEFSLVFFVGSYCMSKDEVCEVLYESYCGRHGIVYLFLLWILGLNIVLIRRPSKVCWRSYSLDVE
jgi:hypothetical protein